MKIDNLGWRQTQDGWVLVERNKKNPIVAATISRSSNMFMGCVNPRTNPHIGPFSSLCKTMRTCERFIESIPSSVEEALQV